MVPTPRFELGRSYALPPQGSVSTNSTTPALLNKSALYFNFARIKEDYITRSASISQAYEKKSLTFFTLIFTEEKTKHKIKELQQK